MEEHIPEYLRVIYKVMYQNAFGRQMIKCGCTKNLLKRATAMKGDGM